MTFSGFSFSRRQWLIVGVAVGVIIIASLVLTGIIPGFVRKRADSVKLSFVSFEDRRVFAPVITSFRKLHPEVEVSYRQVDFRDYENSLINNLAAGKAPDIFMFHSSWLPKHFDKIIPVGDDQFNLAKFEELFPVVARQDFAPSGVIFALPLYLDTLVLLYNKDIFDSEGVALPPRNWLEFQNLVAQLRQVDKKNNLARPAAAIGGSENTVNNATALLNLLMLQTGSPMVDDTFTRANFASQGLTAFNFYLKFADAGSDFYTWNDAQPLAADLFAQGQLPMMFGYRYQLLQLRQQAPLLNIGVAAIPQPGAAGPGVAYADYYGLAVSNKTNYQRQAWDFIIHAAANAEANQLYLEAISEPPALRSLISRKINDQEIGVFARQALLARSWPRVDETAIRQLFDAMIKSVLADQLRSDEALRQAEAEITRLMQRRI